MLKWTHTVGCAIVFACAFPGLAALAKNEPVKSAPAKSAPPKSTPTKSAETRKVRTIVLRQTHYFLGQMVTSVSTEGVRIESVGTYKFVLVAKAPLWQVFVFRNDDKTFHETTLKEFSQSGLLSQYLVGMQEPMVRGRVQKLPKSIGDLPIMKRQNPNAVCEYIDLMEEIAPQCRAIVFNTYRLPCCNGVAIKYLEKYYGKDWMTGIDETGLWKSKLTTSKYEVKKLDAKTFELPANYKRVPSMQLVVTGNETRSRTEGGAADLMDAH